MNYTNYMSSFVKLLMSEVRAAENVAKGAFLRRYVIASCHIQDFKDINYQFWMSNLLLE